MTIAANAWLGILVLYPIQSLPDRYFSASNLSLYGDFLWIVDGELWCRVSGSLTVDNLAGPKRPEPRDDHCWVAVHCDRTGVRCASILQ
jgi:hypothetical protein